ncbi:ADOP family duplicated permease [Silvibacterium sp.]|uniref:ABC transporter permease n=1 Tax=Silvibacterium sp. TaxID=1964179 RepID=UPI0039E51568
MPIVSNLIHAFRSLFRSSRVEQELEDELRDFLAASIAEKMRRGMTPEEAARAARVEMGSTNAVKHRIRSVGWEATMENFWQDLRYSLRTLAHSPAFTLVAVLSLALGIGANTAIFTLVRQVVLQQLPVRDPQQLVTFGKAFSGGLLGGIDPGVEDMYTYDLAHQMELQPGPFAGVAFQSSFSPRVNIRVPGSAAAVQEPAVLVSGDFFKVLGAEPLFGRAIAPFDASASGREAVAVVSYRFWQQSLSADPAAVGKTISVNATRFTVIGVMPPEFHGLKQDLEPDAMWVPVTMADAIFQLHDLLKPRDTYFLQIFARRGVGSSLAVQQQWVNQQIRAYARAGEGKTITPDREKEIGRLQDLLQPAGQGVSQIRNQYHDALALLEVIVGVVLLIACANLANLLLARVVMREREIATRLALGSSRGRIVRQGLMEAWLLSFSGGALGLGIAFAFTRALIAFVARGQDGVPLTARPDAMVLLFTLGVSILAGTLFGLAPALQIRRMGAGPSLNAGSRTGSGAGGRNARWWPRALVTGQITLCLLLLVCAGLFLRSLWKLAGQDFGFERTHLVLAQVDARLAGYQPEQAPAFNQRLIDRLSAIPGVRAAALSGQPPMSYGAWQSSIHPQGYTPGPHEEMNSVLERVSGHYFDALSIAMASGRAITPDDTASSQKVIVVNETLARRYYPAGNAVGHMLSIDADSESGPWLIVGVSRDTRSLGPRGETHPQVYMPVVQIMGKQKEGVQDDFSPTVILRVNGAPESVERELRTAVASIDPNLPVRDVHTIQEHLGFFFTRETLVSRLAILFAGLAVLLAAIGLYGVMSFNMLRRVNEIGIRMALGASTGRVQWMVLRESLMLFLVGFAIGLPAALGLANLMRNAFYQMSPFDPLTFVVATLGIAAVTVLSAWLPARRAARVDPMTALRCD